MREAILWKADTNALQISRYQSDRHTCVLSSSLRKCKVNLRVDAMQWAVRTMVPDKTKFTIADMMGNSYAASYYAQRVGRMNRHPWGIIKDQ